MTTETTASKEQNQAKITELEKERDAYVERLDIGAGKVEEARRQGKDVTEWEDYWIKLLREYEKVGDRVHELYHLLDDSK